MANFDQAFAYLEPDEGGYVNDPRDTGGETYKGVSRKNFPDWDGWALIDTAKSQPNFPKNLPSDPALENAVKRFYKKNFWRYDGLVNQTLANKIFDEAVNLGVGTEVKLLQQALRYVSGKAITVDGQYGPLTETLLNVVDPVRLLSEFEAQIAVYYCKLNRPEYLLGWMRRATK